MKQVLPALEKLEVKHGSVIYLLMDVPEISDGTEKVLIIDTCYDIGYDRCNDNIV